MNSNSNPKTNLNREIETLRAELILSGIENGLDHPNTIELSQRLDELLNKSR